MVGRCDCRCGWGGGAQGLEELRRGGCGGAQARGSWISGGLEDRGYALAASDAHRLQQVAAVPAVKLAQAGGEHPARWSGVR